MSTSATALPVRADELPFFSPKPQNRHHHRSEPLNEASLQAKISQFSKDLEQYIEARQEEEQSKVSNELELKLMAHGLEYYAQSGVSITEEDIQLIEEYRAAILESEKNIKECDKAIFTLKGNIARAQKALENLGGNGTQVEMYLFGTDSEEERQFRLG